METNQELDVIEHLKEMLHSDDAAQLKSYLDTLESSETAWWISHLSQDEQTKLLTMLPPKDAADVIDDVYESQAVEMMEELTPETAAAIVGEMESDHQADVLGEMDVEEADAIIQQMPKKNAADVRQLMTYSPDVAGGLMNKEYLAFQDHLTVAELRANLSRHGSEYSDYDVQYVYIVTRYEMLVGVIRLRDLLFTLEDTKIIDLMIANPKQVKVDSPLAQLVAFFEDNKLLGVPVTDDRNRLVGILRRNSVFEAVEKRESGSFLRSMGIIGGDELRNMELKTRSKRRLSWLSINIVLNLISASVIAMYQDVLAQVIALAFFLPIISDMSGCSGNQAVAVSMRELTMGLIKPREFLRVFFKELPIGMINGFILGGLIGTFAMLWQWNFYLGIVVWGAMTLNTIVAVCLGGLIPLVLKMLKLDPALVSSPVLTTVTDMCGFFFIFYIASKFLPYLV